jgi:energy-coupling factor transporter ATP-binding protein EcfA2
MTEKAEVSAAETTRFIPDVASDKDSFGPHGRVASAIAQVIRDNRNLKVIGLLGPWGSGKSTVVNLVKEALSEDTKVETCFFTYDAWVHQNDPPRRAFLDALIHFLIGKQLPTETTEKQWRDRLDRLNRRVEVTDTTVTPTLTNSGRFIVLSLFLIPLGMQLISRDWYKAALAKGHTIADTIAFFGGLSLVLMPGIVAAIVYWCWRPHRLPTSLAFLKATNWRTHRSPHEDESILSLFMSRQVQRNRNRVTRDPDPTTIEFQDFFREVMESVASPTRRIILVIDNLDRLPHDEAIGMWATIRGFFLGAVETQHVRKAVQEPTVILPIDEEAIHRMYASLDPASADSQSRSFMEKTFDLCFRVTRPVLTGWNTYLKQQMSYVFGEEMSEEWPPITGRFYDRFLTGQTDTTITPRSINTLVNNIALCRLQWRGSDVPYASIAYYCVFRGTIEANIIQAIATPVAGIEELDPNWQRSISAIHFGVGPEQAEEVILDQPLRNAIQSHDSEVFNQLSTVPSFNLILTRIVEWFRDQSSINPDAILNTASLMNKLAPGDSAVVRHLWKTLRSSLRVTSPWTTFGNVESEALLSLLQKCDARERQSFVDLIVDRTSALPAPVTSSSGFAGVFSSFWLQAFSDSQADAYLPDKIAVPGAAGNFISVAAACKSDANLLKRFSSSVTGEDVAAQLTNDIVSIADLVSEERLRAVLATDVVSSWSGLAEAAAKFIRERTADAVGIRASLTSLGLLRVIESKAAEELASLSNSGHLLARLDEAYSQNILAVLPILVSLFILTKSTQGIPQPDGWTEYFTKRPDLPGEINRCMDEFGETKSSQVSSFVEATTVNSSLTSLVQLLFSAGVREGSIKQLPIDDILARLDVYLGLLNADVHTAFIARLPHFEGFWDKLKAHSFDAAVSRIVRILVHSDDSTAFKAQSFAREKLNDVATATWTEAISKNSEPLTIAVDLSAALSGALEITSLFDPLSATIQQVLSSTDPAYRSRWFTGVSFLGLNAKSVLLQNMRDQMNAGVAVVNLPSLLLAGDGVLLEVGDFEKKADDSVRHVLISLLSDEEGIALLNSRSEALKSWIDQSSETTVKFLRERLDEASERSPEVARAIEILRSAWGLPSPTIGSETVRTSTPDPG